jgi:hypothetical protein
MQKATVKKGGRVSGSVHEKRLKLVTILGVYLVVLSVYQFGLYSWPRYWSLLISPRIGIDYVLAMYTRVPNTAMPTLDLAFGFWELLLATSFLIHKPLVRLYIASELLLSIPTLVWADGILVAGGGHVLGRGDAFVSLIVVLLFSAVPLSLAIYIYVSQKYVSQKPHWQQKGAISPSREIGTKQDVDQRIP